MRELPFDSMICDSDKGDGSVYFYTQYFEWINRSTGDGFRVWYKDIDDIKIIQTMKKKVIVTMHNQTSVNLYLYKADTLVRVLYDQIDNVIKKQTEEVRVDDKFENDKSEDDISKLERLAKLHESGALTDEEFVKAKALILNK